MVAVCEEHVNEEKN